MRRLTVLTLLVTLFSNIAYGGFGGYLKADTAVDLIVGPFIDDTDGKTAETGLTITQAEVRLSKNGANTAQKNEGTSLTHDELGNYVCKLDTTDTNTEGILTLMVHESGALAIKIEYMVVNANVFDSLFAAATTDYLQVDTIQVTGTGQTANDMSGDIDDILVDTGTTLDDLIDTEIGTIVTAVGNIETDTEAWDTAGEATALLADLEVDLTKIHGSIITETTSGMFADNWDTFFDNADSATAKTLDDVGGASGLEVDVTKIHGSALSETNAGDLADSFTFFFDVDPTTTKTVDDVGAVATGGGSSLVLSVGDLGNFKEDATIAFTWRSIDQGGAAVDPSTAGTIKIYKESSDVEVTAPTGITDTRGFDGLTGIHLLVVDLGASTFYARNMNYSVVLTGATVDSQTTTAVIATFSIEKRYVDEFDRTG